MAVSKAPQSKSALQVLQDDHRTVNDLFAQFEKLGPRAKKGREAIVTKVVQELSVHAAIEEMVFYPAVRERLAMSDDMVLEALEEHHVVKILLAELDGMSAGDERYSAKMTVLIEIVRHHVAEEEGDMFPKVRKAMTRTELEDLGAALVEARRGAPTRPHPGSPDTPPANFIAAAVTVPLDAARSAGEAAVRRVRSLSNR